MIIAAALGGCASRGHRSDERAQSYPENYKAELLQFLHSYVNDPTQIREAEIADPALMPNQCNCGQRRWRGQCRRESR
jgi:hypothetical protein